MCILTHVMSFEFVFYEQGKLKHKQTYLKLAESIQTSQMNNIITLLQNCCGQLQLRMCVNILMITIISLFAALQINFAPFLLEFVFNYCKKIKYYK